ncbi:uncharacterized protein F4822DRAFT_435284 [Hypoxylon trugodes]|uniref:uncharacterized protein n=1 Tax=Hypoxylon trugodes TaxID=326681 RepID=UPI00219F3A10|nr:uncharacterized protein F4822DRAFT_435284 [Hypoxylon trugodes]KAI1382607.1 hypothetical protein F4822DRAFT_435284 [Hypoxylon trugodes]
MSIINLIPLFLGGCMNVIADCCGISLRTYARIHRSLGRVAILEGLIHVAVAILNHLPNLEHVADRAALAATAIFLVILFSGLLWQRWYEAFFYLHFLLGSGAVAVIYLHSPAPLFALPTRYLFTAVCLQIASGMLRCSHILYQNVRYRRPLGRASIRTIKFWHPPTRSRSDDAASLCETDLPVPDVVHLHPFYVAWRHRDRGNDYAVLIVQKQGGFSRRLFSRRGNDVDSASDMMALVEGLYGKELRLDLYGTMLLFATGIGIASQLPYVEHLLTGYQNCEVKTQRIALFWEVESESKYCDAGDSG